MNADLDVTPFLKAKSDQINGDDLIGGPITVQVTSARVPGGDQPVVLGLSGGHAAYKPCKTMRRLLAAAWGANAGAWVGRWMTLYRDPTARFGGMEVGGIRISHLSDLDAPKTFNLTEAKGKKKAWRVEPLRQTEQRQQGRPTADLTGLLVEAGLTDADVDRWRASLDKPKAPISTLNDDERAQFAGWLSADPKRLDAIRALIPAAPADDAPATTNPPAGREPGDDQE